MIIVEANKDIHVLDLDPVPLQTPMSTNHECIDVYDRGNLALNKLVLPVPLPRLLKSQVHIKHTGVNINW